MTTASVDSGNKPTTFHAHRDVEFLFSLAVTDKDHKWKKKSHFSLGKKKNAFWKKRDWSRQEYVESYKANANELN